MKSSFTKMNGARTGAAGVRRAGECVCPYSYLPRDMSRDAAQPRRASDTPGTTSVILSSYLSIRLSS